MVSAAVECSGCGSVSRRDAAACAYCGAPLALGPEHAARVALAAGEFGFRSGAALAAGIAAVVAAYLAGWALEDTRYWLDEAAVAVWCGVEPLAALLVAVGWRARWGGLLPGLGLASIQALAHLGAMAWMRDLRVNDDVVGIAVGLALPVLFGWLAGRGLHTWVRRQRARARP